MIASGKGVSGNNPVWLVWKADSVVGKNKICLLPVVFRGTRCY